MVTNLFGDLSLDSTIKALKNVISRFTFDAGGQLRTVTSGYVSISSGTVTTVTTVTTSNGSIGDSGKTSTIMQNSSMMFNSSVRRNFA
jgi:hypothetical protein